tara:strand:- start:3074 stop:4117 length:1044 start_codon:yes stop_codon:yes gene_type:complete
MDYIVTIIPLIIILYFVVYLVSGSYKNKVASFLFKLLVFLLLLIPISLVLYLIAYFIIGYFSNKTEYKPIEIKPLGIEFGAVNDTTKVIFQKAENFEYIKSFTSKNIYSLLNENGICKANFGDKLIQKQKVFLFKNSLDPIQILSNANYSFQRQKKFPVDSEQDVKVTVSPIFGVTRINMQFFVTQIILGADSETSKIRESNSVISEHIVPILIEKYRTIESRVRSWEKPYFDSYRTDIDGRHISIKLFDNNKMNYFNPKKIQLNYEWVDATDNFFLKMGFSFKDSKEHFNKNSLLVNIEKCREEIKDVEDKIKKIEVERTRKEKDKRLKKEKERIEEIENKNINKL